MNAICKKKRIWAPLAALALAAFCAPAQAYIVDTLIGAIDSTSSGQAYEEAQLESFAGENVTLLSNIDTDTFLIDGDGNNYIDVTPNEPGYFILKFGAGNAGNDMFFFRNIAELTKLVWTDLQLTEAGLPEKHVESISHYAITNDGGTTVPEPGTLLLIGVGLAGLGLVGRRRKV